jgi:hypothetical protein
VEATFRAPLDFVYDWCTNYTPEDPGIEGGKFVRKILERGPRRAVFEDLEKTPTGWILARSEVSLEPPHGWFLVERGNRVEAAARYLLTEQTDGKVRLDLWWRRRPLVPNDPKRSRAQRERGSTIAWQRFARELERDYRRACPPLAKRK